MSIDNIAKTLAPRRGTTSSMATGTKKDLVLAPGEIFIEYPNAGIGTLGEYRIKFGDGATPYSALPYAFTNNTSSSIITFTEDTSTTPAAAIEKMQSGAGLNTIIAAAKQAITLDNALFNEHDADTDAHVSETDREEWNAAYTHSQAAHAPSDAEKNVIVTIKRNGETLTVDSDRAVDITDENTTYSYGVNGNNKPDGEVELVLTADGETESGSILIKGGENSSVTTDESGNVIIDSVDTIYVHPESGVTSGSYNSVTVNETGHVTAANLGLIYPGNVTAVVDIADKSIIASYGTSYGPIEHDAKINILYPILYTDNSIAKDETSGITYIFGSFDISGTANFTKNGTILFAKGLLNGVEFTVDSITTTQPTSADGYEYLALGITAGENKLILTNDHQIYRFTNGVFGRYSDTGDYGTEDPMSTI